MDSKTSRPAFVLFPLFFFSNAQKDQLKLLTSSLLLQAFVLPENIEKLVAKYSLQVENCALQTIVNQ